MLANAALTSPYRFAVYLSTFMGYSNGLSFPCRCTNFTEGAVSISIFAIITAITCGPVIFVLVASKNIAILLLSILIVLIWVADYAVTQVCLIAIAPSISHTVAQRFNPVAYFCVISIASVLYYAVGLIGAGFIGNEMSDMDWFHACFQCLGLVIMSLVLVFPASFPDLGIKVTLRTQPVSPPFLASDPENVFGMRPENWYDQRASATTPAVQRINTLQVFPISGNISGLLHMIVFVLGYAMEAASLIVYLARRHTHNALNTWWRIYILVALVVSLVCFVVFCVSQGLQLYWSVNVPKQVQLCFEMFAIFMMIMGVIMLSLGEGNLVNGFGSI